MPDLKLVFTDTKVYWVVHGPQRAIRLKGPIEIYTRGEVHFSQITFQDCRIKGPSKICPDGYIAFTNTIGLAHRTDGPAIIWPDGRKAYWVNGHYVSPEEFFLKYGVV